MKSIKLKVSGMMCGNCQKHVTDTLINLEGVQQVDVSLEKQEAIIEYDGIEPAEKLITQAFKETNYQINF